MTAAVGDTVTFTWQYTHSVLRVYSQANYDNCDPTGGDLLADSSLNFYQHTLGAAGVYWFICAVDQHCLFGQKIAITVPFNLLSNYPNEYTK